MRPLQNYRHSRVGENPERLDEHLQKRNASSKTPFNSPLDHQGGGFCKGLAESIDLLNVSVCEERRCHIADIHDLVRAAFGQNDEAILVDRLRDAGALVVSMVLVVNHEPVAHAAASPMSWSCGTNRTVVFALAPVSVKPEKQRMGYGSRIVRATIDRCRAAGGDILTVLGDPSYYGRFGFKPASQYGLKIENADFGDAFMVTELMDGALSEAQGSLQWHPAFASLGEE